MGVFHTKKRTKRSKMKKDALSELNSNNVSSTADSTDGGANCAETASIFNSLLLVQLLLPLTLATFIWGRKWIFSRAFLHFDRSCISVICPSISKRERLLRWTSEQLTYNGGIQDAQLSNLWLDGRHLCTLINSVVPGACANPHRHWRRPPTHAQALAYKYLGIIPVFTEDDFQTKTISSNLEQNFQNYLTELQKAISKISEEQEELKRSHINNYIARGMGLSTGEQHRKNCLYIYPTNLNRRYDDVIITMKGPYNTYGSVILNNMNMLNRKLTDAPYESSVGKKIQQQCESVKRNEPSFLRSLSMDLTNIMNTGIAIKEQDPFDFNIKIEKGRAKVAFISQNSGIHELCITTNGEHISGSPFNINIEKNSSGVLDSFTKVEDEHVCKSFNRKIIKREIDFITEKMVSSGNVSLHNFPILEESIINVPIKIPPIESKRKLPRQDNLTIDQEINISKATIDVVGDEINNAEVERVPQHFRGDESIESIPNVAAELEMLVVEEEKLDENTLVLQNADITRGKYLLSQENALRNCSSDLSNIELEEQELEDTDLSEPISLESTNKLDNVQKSNNKVASKVRKLSSKLSSNHSIYCSSEFSTNSIELELQDNDLSSDEFLYFGQNIFPQVNTVSETSPWPNSNISVKEIIAYYNKSPREIEEQSKKVYTPDFSEPMECSTFVPDILTCHTVKQTEITNFASPIWQHIVQEENLNQSITSHNTSSEIGQESNVLNTSLTSSNSTNNKDFYSSADSCLEENNNSSIRDFHKYDFGEQPQTCYNKSSEEFSEMFRKRKQFWDMKSLDNSSGCSSESSLSNPIVSSYSFYNNRRLSSEKSIDGSSNFHRSLDCFQSQHFPTQPNISDDDLCKSTDDLAFPSVKERKLLFIRDMNNHWSKGHTSLVKVKYINNQKLNMPEKVTEREVKRLEEESSPKASVMDKIKIFNQDKSLKSMLNQPELQNNKNIFKPKDFVPLQSKKFQKVETILSNKENFTKAQSYFKTLESGRKIKSIAEFNANQITRRHSMDCENKINKWEAEIKAGNLTLPRVSEKFPLDNIYKDVLGDRKNTTHFKGSANKVRMIVTLHSMPDQAIRELNVESEFKEELFFGQKKFKDRPKLNSVFPIHY